MINNVAFDVINVFASLVVFAIIAYKLSINPDKFTWVERLGMGLLAAGCVMTIGPLTSDHSPFDDWSATLMRFGTAMYFIGRMTRHWLNNRHMRAYWKHEKGRRG